MNIFSLWKFFWKNFSPNFAAVTASPDAVMQKQQDTEIAALHTENAFLSRSVENATQTMEHQKAAHIKQIRALSNNQEQQKVVLTEQIRVLSVQNNNRRTQ